MQVASLTAMAMDDLHFEPYVHLAGLTHESVLISWGGFFFRPGKDEGLIKPERRRHQHTLLDDDELSGLQKPRKDSIGERSRSYGPAVVRVRTPGGATVAEVSTERVNHAWVEGLEPDTEYCYEIAVDGRNWIADHRFDWSREGDRAGLLPSSRRYSCRFRTHPAPETHAPLTFAVLGDFGIGIGTDSDDARRQSALARGMAQAIDQYNVRLVLTTGDNIYMPDAEGDASGDEDDDWFFSFYQPYRYILDRVPVYPTVGNHDSSETEQSDDRDQLDDNFFIRQRFTARRDETADSETPGLFYRFDFGADITFVCLDTTHDDQSGACYFERDDHRRFLEESFAEDASRTRPWLIPFSHHPTFCAGPCHGNTQPMVKHLVPFFERAGVSLVLAGHEHNFQYSRHHDVHYVISGAGGKLRTDPPSRFEEAHTVAWAAEGHFLIVSLDARQAVVHVLTAAEDGTLRPLTAVTPGGEPFRTPIVIPRRGW